jgi:hypothetical protein
MAETDATATTKPTAQPSSATGETILVSVRDAAELLGISPQAVRKHIAAGKLPARKHRGAWQIALDPATAATSATATGETLSQPPRATAQPPVATADVERYNAMIAPFLDRLEAQAERIGRLEAALAAADAERDALRAAQAAPEAASEAEAAANDAEDGSSRWRRFWARWWQGERE